MVIMKYFVYFIFSDIENKHIKIVDSQRPGEQTDYSQTDY